MNRTDYWRAEVQEMGWARFLRRRWLVSLNRLLWQQLPVQPLGPAYSPVAIDVFIPVAAKDLPVLPHTLRALRANLRHPLGEICLVAPDLAEAREVAADEGCRFVLEAELVPRPALDHWRSPGKDRSGWLYQQLLKLSADRVCARSHILLADADTVWVQPHCFVRGDRSALLFAQGLHWPYYETYQRLLGEPAPAVVSFVSHYMLVQAQWLAELRAAIEARHGEPWWQAVLNQVDPKIRSSFSEYETYANFVLARAPDSVWLEPWRNLDLPPARLSELPGLAKRARRMYRSISFHSRTP